VINVCVLGGAGVGKADLVRAMTSIAAQPAPHTHDKDKEKFKERGTGTGTGAGADRVPSGVLSHTPSFSNADVEAMVEAEGEVPDSEMEGYPLHVLRTGYDCDAGDASGEPKSACESTYIHGSCAQSAYGGSVSIVFTAVPYDRAVDWLKNHGSECDIALLVIDCRESLGADNASIEVLVSDSDVETGRIGCEVEAEMCSFLSAQRLEILLPSTLPRLYVANRSDLLESHASLASKGTGWGRGSGATGPTPSRDDPTQKALRPVFEHLQKHQLLPLTFVSTVTGEGIEEVKRVMLKASSNPTLGIPSAYRMKKKSSEFIWVAGRVMCAVVTVALVATAIILRRDTCKEEKSTGPTTCISWVRRMMLRVLAVTGRGE
jgi:hypothetical protein